MVSELGNLSEGNNAHRNDIISEYVSNMTTGNIPPTN